MRWLLGLAIGAVLWGAVGCGVDPGETGGSGGGGGGTTGSGGGSPCDDPANGPVPESCGVWVSVSLGNDANPGTQGEPVASLAQAVELARGATEHVYACAETWTDSLILPGNMGLHGGFDCENGWAYLGKKKRSMLTTPPDQIALVVRDDGSGGKATITDFQIEAAAAAKPGGSSIGILVRDTVPLSVYRCEVIAGDGADGLDGTAPADPAADGAPGNAGDAACSAAVSKGGVSVETACEVGGSSKGGAGGDGAQLTAGNGAAGEPATGNPEDGAAGIGEVNAMVCTDGKPGANGAAGEFGLGAKGFENKYLGRLTVDGYVGMAGEDGKPGAPGQGGGGGGATLGSAAVCGAANPGGAAGGSGGNGGCGGKGGGGGQPGGASIAVALLNKFGFYDSQLYTGNGGKGGDGVPGQLGGAGGDGAPGGPGMGTVKTACAGGKGGVGGKGGWGGGGLGGASVVIGMIAPEGNAVIGSDNDSGKHAGQPGDRGVGDPMHVASLGREGQAGNEAVFAP